MNRPAVPHPNTRNMVNAIHSYDPRDQEQEFEHYYSDREDDEWDLYQDYLRPTRGPARRPNSRRAKSTDYHSSGYEADTVYVYPVNPVIEKPKKKASPKEKPYVRHQPTRRTKVNPFEEEDSQRAQQMPHHQDEEMQPEGTPYSESMAEENLAVKPRQPRTYAFNTWDRIGDSKVEITVKELFDISPAAKASFRAGMVNRHPKHGIAASI